jgi:ATP-dependent RNA helicase HelY
VAGCPDLAQHLRAARRAERISAEARRVERRLDGHRDSLTRQLDAVLDLLSEWGYVRGWTLTASGRRLANLYHEADLLVAHSLELGCWDGLPAPELAGLGAAFTYEPRGPNDATRAPERGLRQRWQQVEAVSRELAAAERERHLVVTRALDPGFMSLAEAWAKGYDLDRLLAADLTSGGDFVRNVKQLIDLLRQVEGVAAAPATRAAAADAARRLFRGVIAASSIVEAPPASAGPVSSGPASSDPVSSGPASSGPASSGPGRSAGGPIPPRPLAAQ